MVGIWKNAPGELFLVLSNVERKSSKEIWTSTKEAISPRDVTKVSIVAHACV